MTLAVTLRTRAATKFMVYGPIKRNHLVYSKHHTSLNPTPNPFFLNWKPLPATLEVPPAYLYTSPPPQSASVDFADRMIFETRDYNYQDGSQTRKLIAMP